MKSLAAYILGAAAVVTVAALAIQYRAIAPADRVAPPVSPSFTQSAPAREVGWHRIVVIKLACRSRETTERMEQIRGSGDKAAFTSAASAAISSGRCVVLNVGDEVNTVEVAMWAGMINLRKRGETDSYWTYLSAIDR